MTAFPASQVNEPAKHLSPKTAAADRFARNQVIDIQKFAPGEVFQDAKASAADALAFILQKRQAKAGRLLSLDAGQE